MIVNANDFENGENFEGSEEKSIDMSNMFMEPGEFGDMYGGFGDMYGGFGDMYDYDGMYGDYGSQVSVEKLLSREDVDRFIEGTDGQTLQPAVLGFFDEEKNQIDIQKFESTAKVFGERMRFGYSSDIATREQFKSKTGCAVYIYLPKRLIDINLEKRRIRYPSKTIDEESFFHFLNQKASPLVGQLSMFSIESYFTSSTPALTIFSNLGEDEPGNFDKVAGKLRKLAANYKEKIVFNIADVKQFNFIIENWKIPVYQTTENHADFVAVLINTPKLYYTMDTNELPTTQHIEQFVKDFLENKLTGIVKQLPDDKSNLDQNDNFSDMGPVVMVTQENFNEVVYDSNKNVLIEFFAPWCTHCKQLKPTYISVAESLKNRDSITVAAMDASQSDVPEPFIVEGFPTIYFVPAKDKTPISYDGPRTENSLIEFINQHAQ